jgi:tetratricopeptide (TPR) repeat protein
MASDKINTPQEAQDSYYDAMDYLNAGDTTRAKKMLEKAIKLDEDYVEAYVGMTAMYREIGNFKKEKEYVDLAYEKTRQKFPVWPEKMIWGIIENRQYLRAICDKATTNHITGNLKEAEKLYRLILKLNPRDNQGVRYLIAGMFAGLSPQDIDDMFDEGNELQNWDKLAVLLDEQNEKHKFWSEPIEY